MTFIIYYGSLIIYFIGNIKNIPQLLSNQNMNISVIIAIKNGAISLPNLLSDLQQQEYKGVMEFILIDDESEDESDEEGAEERKEMCSKGLEILETVMEKDDQRLCEGDFVELCNLLKELHKK